MFDKNEIDIIIYKYFKIKDSKPSNQLISTNSYKLLSVDNLIGEKNDKTAIDSIYHCVKPNAYLRIIEIIVNDKTKYVFHISWDDRSFKVFTLSRWHWSQDGYLDKTLDSKLYWDLDHNYSWANNYAHLDLLDGKIQEVLSI